MGRRCVARSRPGSDKGSICQVSPALWAAVRARIEEDLSRQQWAVGSGQKAAFVHSLARFREWFSGTVSTLRLNPAVVAVLAFVIIGAIVCVMSYMAFRGSVPSREVVMQSGGQDSAQPDVNPNRLVATGNAREEGAEIRRKENNSPHTASRRNAGRGDRSKSLLAANEKRIKRADPQLRSLGVEPRGDELNGRVPQQHAAAYRRTAALRRAEPEQFPSLETETAHHVERAELLLRSFRNADLSGKAFDLAYEKQRSRSLLYRNILLRRNATAKGNLPTEELLGSLEPILIDIANLPHNPSAEDVRAVVERMQRKEIVAALQIHSMQTSRMNY